MDIGLSILLTAGSIDAAVLAKRAEELGFESIWAPEQNILPVHTDKEVPKLWAHILDPLVMLARASAVTSHIKLGTAVVVVPERNPLLLAKETATLDVCSGGRFLLGIGVGGLREASEVFGVDFPRRWIQAREAMIAIKSLWTEEEAEHHGQYYNFPAIYSYPKPIQQPHPPVLLGGRAPHTLPRVVEWGDGWLPIGVTPADVEQARAEIDRQASAAGRDPRSISITVIDVRAEREVIRQFADAGADRVTVSVATAGERESLDEMEQLAEKVLR